MRMKHITFRPVLDLLEDRNAPGEIIGLSALPLSMLSWLNSYDAPPPVEDCAG